MQGESPRSEGAARRGAAAATAAVTLLVIFWALTDGDFDRGVMRFERTVGVAVSVAGALWLMAQVLLSGVACARDLAAGIVVVLAGVLVANYAWAPALALGGMGIAFVLEDRIGARTRG